MASPPPIENLDRILAWMAPYVHRVWERRRLFVLINGGVAAVTVIVLIFLVPPYFESTITILPEFGSKSGALSQLSELASFAGVSVGQESPTEIYQNLLYSELVMGPVILSKYATKQFKDSVNLIEYFDFELDEHLPYETAHRKVFIKCYEYLIKQRLATEFSGLTKILTVRVEMPESQLSADVANRVAASLESYISVHRATYATYQSRYIKTRVDQLSDTLKKAEERLREFRERNRMVVESPMLLLTQARLVRDVEIQTSVFLELTKQLEISRLDEIKNTPVLNVREPAQDPILKSGPKRIMWLSLIVLSCMFFTALIFSFEHVLVEFWPRVRNLLP